MKVQIKEIDRGPHKGRWAWKLDLAQRRANLNVANGHTYERPGKLQGIASTELRAKITAGRQLRWHIGGRS